MTNGFTHALIRQLLEDIYNMYSDNYDIERFGGLNKPQVESSYVSLVRKINDMLPGGENFSYTEKVMVDNIEQFDYCGLSNTYNMLEDQKSKDLLVKIMAYRILGSKRVKFWFCNEQYWKDRAFVHSLIEQKDVIPIDFMNWKLSLFNLSKIGYPISLYYIAMGVYATFCSKQYEYPMTDRNLKADIGDVVIDAGGCWGDTALYFAHEVGAYGKVYTFEFIPSNLEIIKKNIAINPSIGERIEIIENPVWEVSNVSLYCVDNGPGSRVSSERLLPTDFEVSTISIDDFVNLNNISRVDFIKMDIEGSELNALKGAEKTLRRFKPKLAISVYHKLSDLTDIPNFIKGLDLDYKYYLGHHTIHLEETILYAQVR